MDGKEYEYGEGAEAFGMAAGGSDDYMHHSGLGLKNFLSNKILENFSLIKFFPGKVFRYPTLWN